MRRGAGRHSGGRKAACASDIGPDHDDPCLEPRLRRWIGRQCRPAGDRASFGATAETLQWVVNAYLLLLSALLLLGGAAGDRYGRKRLLIGGIAIFALASLFCATAADMSWLLLGRAVQGIGAAILLPNSLAILGDAFTGAERGRAIGIWAAMGAIAGAIGPVLGGFLIDTVGWRAIFLLNLPLAAAAIALAIASVEDTRAGADRASLDVLGGLLATAGLGALTWALTIGSGRAGWNGEAILAAAAGAALMLAFVRLERVRGERAMMPLALFGSRTFAGPHAVDVLPVRRARRPSGPASLRADRRGALLRNRSGRGAPAVSAGDRSRLALARHWADWRGASARGCRSRSARSWSPRDFACCLRIDGSNGYWSVVLPAVLVIALGMAGAVAPLTTAVLASVDQAHTGFRVGLQQRGVAHRRARRHGTPSAPSSARADRN